MDSSDLWGFSSWKRVVASTMPDCVPQKPGVYAFRVVGQAIGRLKGESDLIYVGFARDLRDRLRDHLRSLKSQRNALKRVHEEVAPLEVAWKACGTPHDAKEQERAILRSYKEKHIEFPPLNHQESGKKMNAVQDAIEDLQPSERQEALRNLAEKLRPAPAKGTPEVREGK